MPFVITVLVFLVDASMHARSPQAQRALDNQAWVDAVIPQITASGAQGTEIANITGKKMTEPASAIASELAGIAAQAASTYRSVRGDTPPAQMATGAGLLDACLAAREQGARQLAAGARNLLGGGRRTSVLAQMSSAASDFQLSDEAYQLFVNGMPKLGLDLPPSEWAPKASLYSPAALSAFSDRLLGARGKAPARLLSIDAVTTQPRALSVQGGVEVLSPASSISVTVVVANGSAAPESGVLVAAAITPSAGGAQQQVRATVDLPPGQASAVTLYGLATRLSSPTRLTVTAELPAGAVDGPALATRELRIVVPGPNFRGIPTTQTSYIPTSSTSLGSTSTTSAGAPSSTTAPSTPPAGPSASTTTVTSSAPPAATTTTGSPPTTSAETTTGTVTAASTTTT